MYHRDSEKSCELVGTDGTDSDFASHLDHKRSLIGKVFSLAGCVVSWKASLQLTLHCL